MQTSVRVTKLILFGEDGLHCLFQQKTTAPACEIFNTRLQLYLSESSCLTRHYLQKSCET